MNLLTNELILKYFGDDWSSYESKQWEKELSLRILTAMTEPINNDDLYINETAKDTWELKKCGFDGMCGKTFHPFHLKLPSRFQFPPHTHKGVCECGVCIWNGVAIEPAPSSQEKCEHGCTESIYSNECPKHSPEFVKKSSTGLAEDVEKFIQAMIIPSYELSTGWSRQVMFRADVLESNLRALVALAQKGKK